jgi:hypothetical protein
LISHSVTAPGTNTTYTANFQTQYLLTTLANPVAGGTVSGTGYYVAGATAAVTATPASQYAFSSFTGTTSAPTVNPGSVVMNAPTTVTANFVNATLTVSREQAVVTLAAGNPTVVQVKNPTSTAGPLTFNATIRQANEGDAPGNISLAVPVTCTLTPVFPPQQVLQATATVSGGGVGGTLNASCTFAAVPVNLYEVAIGIGGNYYTGTGIGLLLVY